jgi:protein-tyrosine phosphatase
MRILFFCMGNICRSPTAEAVFRDLVRREAPKAHFEIDSAGTHDYHIGNPPDPRSIEAAQRRGFDMSALRARQLERADFGRFDLLLAMDERNRRDALAIAPGDVEGITTDRLQLLLDYAPQLGLREVPDPYYGGPKGFEHVLDIVEVAARGLLDTLIRVPR